MAKRPEQLRASPYDTQVHDIAARYEAVSCERIHGSILDLLPKKPAYVLDVGCGSGRDAAWFADHGHTVVAAEPSAGMRTAAAARHGGDQIRWLDDRLPGLPLTFRLGLQFDFILLSAVWMHVTPAERRRAFRKLTTLMAPNGRMAISLRFGPPDPKRAMFSVSREELEHMAYEFGLRLVRLTASEDVMERPDIRWETLVFEFPDDDTGALPLLRHIILRDDKASTYKLALLRVLTQIASAAPGFARITPDDRVSVPLGLVALFWIRMMKPLIERDLPQTATSRNGLGLGFVKEAFRSLGAVPNFDLRPGMRFGVEAEALTAALRDAAKTICSMPARFITYPGGSEPVFVTQKRRVRLSGGPISLEEPFLRLFGDFLIPDHVWRTLSRLDVWIEPVLTAEWIALMQGYGKRQERHLRRDVLAQALKWLDPVRDTKSARDRAVDLIHNGVRLACVWTGKRINPDRFDIDHCFPFSAWPCSDLWNLLPSSRRVNQHEKKDKLVSSDRLDEARERIVEWWQIAWIPPEHEVWRPQFYQEAQASLPLAILAPEEPTLDDIFDGVKVRRLLLRQTQGLPEWNG